MMNMLSISESMMDYFNEFQEGTVYLNLAVYTGMFRNCILSTEQGKWH